MTMAGRWGWLLGVLWLVACGDKASTVPNTSNAGGDDSGVGGSANGGAPSDPAVSGTGGTSGDTEVGATAGDAGAGAGAGAGGVGSELDPLADDDGDGLDNATERALRLDPQSWDTDDDGFPDPDEVADAKHPKDADSDGIIDALESDLTDNDQDGTYDTTDVAAGWQVAAGRLYPHAIANDGKDSTRIEVVVTGPGVTRVALQSPAQFYDPSVLPNELQIDGKPLGNAALELYDDGTHGDRFAAAASRSRVLQATRRGRLRAQPLRRRARTTLSR